MLIVDSNQNQDAKSVVLFLPDGSRHAVSIPPEAAPAVKGGIPKNKRPGTPGSGKYVLLSKSLASWGKVPRQQADVAAIISEKFEVGVPISEEELFGAVVARAPGFPSLARSVQDPTYVFRYYRGLKNDGKYCGYVGRGFLKEVAQ